jgi:uncharacterized protein
MQFCDNTSLHDVQSSMQEIAPGKIEAAAMQLYRLGLLQSNDASRPSTQQETNHTLTAWLHVTNACNLSCQYCYIRKSNESMAQDTAIESVNAVFRSASKHNFKRVRLKYAGGEASLHMLRVMAVHDYAVQMAQQHDLLFSAALLTNGVVLTQHAVENLKQRNISVSISLDGIGADHDSQRSFRSGHGSFKYINTTIHRLLDNGIAPHIMVTVSQRSLGGLNDLLNYILDLGLSFSLSYYRDHENALDHQSLQFGEQQMIDAMRSAFKSIEQKLPRRSLLGSLIDKANMTSSHQHTCGVGNNYLVIDQGGKVAKCQAHIQHTVSTVTADDPLQVVRADRHGIQNLPVDEKEGCRTCDWRYWCGGGCPLLTYRVTHRYDIKSPNCNIYRALFPEALHLEGLRLLKYETPTVF